MPTPPATACAAPVMMVLSLKPTPVSVTTPITMPTVAAAAPTASAYLAPVLERLHQRRQADAALDLRSARTSSAVATSATAKMPSLAISSRCRRTPAPAAAACSSRQQRPVGARCCPHRVVRPDDGAGADAGETPPGTACARLTRMVISSTSGISVGQRWRRLWRSLGISSSVRPRRP
jgi:hypothetical protein